MIQAPQPRPPMDAMQPTQPSQREVLLAERQASTLHLLNRVLARSVQTDALPVVSRDGHIDTANPQPGVYVMPSTSPELIDKPGAIVEKVDFGFEPRRISGAADSAHTVLAGQLGITYANGTTNTMQVAAKCYSKRDWGERVTRAAREVDFSSEMRDLGKLNLPVELVIVAPPEVADGPCVLLTQYVDGLYTLDNAPWRRGATPDNLQTARQAAAVLGEFNAGGRMHGDAKIKNVGALPTGAVGMIDFETSQRTDPTDVYSAQLTAHTDLGLLLDSLDQKGLFDASSVPEKREAVGDICRTYIDAWHQAPADVQMGLITATEEVAQHVVRDTSGRAIV